MRREINGHESSNPQRRFLYHGRAQRGPRDADPRERRVENISAAQLRIGLWQQLASCRRGESRRAIASCIFSENRPEWAVADFACLLLGVVDVPIYATQTSDQCLFVMQNCEARVAFVSSRKQYEKIAAIREQTGLEYVVIMDDAPELTEAVPMQSFLRSATTENDPASGRHRTSGRARRSGHTHLYVGHNGHAEGRDAHARQYRVEPQRLARYVRVRQGRPVRVLPPAFARHSAPSRLRTD